MVPLSSPLMALSPVESLFNQALKENNKPVPPYLSMWPTKSSYSHSVTISTFVSSVHVLEQGASTGIHF